MRFTSFMPLTALFVLFAGGCIFPKGAPPDRSRAEFARALARIKENTPQSEVLAMLCQPDDVRTQFDPGGISRVQTKEVWCYGTTGHLCFPTLGCVYIDGSGRTQEVIGGQGRPPKSGLFTEDELRNLLRLLDTTPKLEGDSYDPLPVIQIVNTLQSLGREKALAAIGEYLRVSEPWSDRGSSLVFRVLFDLPDDIDRTKGWIIGVPEPPGPKNPHQIPRFPIVLVDDVPLMLVEGYTIGSYLSLKGNPTPVERDLEFFRRNGHFRSKALVPSNDPLGALMHLVESTQWIYADSKLAEPGVFSFGDTETNKREKSMLMEQLLRLIDSVYRLPTDAYGDRLPSGASLEPAWKKIVANVSSLKIEWDLQKNIFVFQDGSQLPKLTSKIHQRDIWRLIGMGFEDAELIIERKSDDWVDVMVTRVEKAGAKLRPATLILFTGDENQASLLTFTFTDKVAIGGGGSETRTVALKADTEIRARLEIAGYRTNTSFIFKP